MFKAHLARNTAQEAPSPGADGVRAGELQAPVRRRRRQLQCDQKCMQQKQAWLPGHAYFSGRKMPGGFHSHHIRPIGMVASWLFLSISVQTCVALPMLSVVEQGAVSVLPLSRPASIFTENAPTLLRVPTSLIGVPGCPQIPADSMANYLSTAYVGLCVANITAFNASVNAPPLGYLLDTCSIPFSGESWRNWPPDDVPNHTEWLRNYHGIFSALILAPGSSSASLLALLHGEDKNELCWANDELYQGTINTNVDAHTCYSGFHNASFEDCTLSRALCYTAVSLYPSLSL
jgi:hypothetical protein